VVSRMERWCTQTELFSTSKNEFGLRRSGHVVGYSLARYERPFLERAAAGSFPRGESSSPSDRPADRGLRRVAVPP
jgi:hypothetical protein